jgi:L-lactate dehydrogenase (cytochrome)
MDEIISRSVEKTRLGHSTPKGTPEVQSAKQAERTPLAWHHRQLKEAARRRLPRPIFDYVDGGGYDEFTLRANVADLAVLKLRQRVFADVATRNQRTRIAGELASMPVALAPVGFASLICPRGEILAARAARTFGVPFCLSTFSVCSLEGIAGSVGGPFFFQLYPFKDRGINAKLVDRAEEAGCSALLLTLDAAVPSRRNRDLDNGLTVPLHIGPRLVLQMISRPRWLAGWLRSNRTMGNLAMFAPRGADLGDILGWIQHNYKGPDETDVEWLRARWPGKLIVKGILDADDARKAIALGADAIVVSNHGGRQLDHALSTTRAFPAIRDAVGDKVELLFDGGVRSGLDVLKVLGLGAKGCLIGRAFAYGLAAHGEAGVTTALQLIAQELDAAMALTGVADVNALPPGVVIETG